MPEIPAPRPLLVFGCGGFGRETVEVVRAINAGRPTWELRGFIDDNPELTGTSLDGVPVLGSSAAIGDHGDAMLVVCVATPRIPELRRQVVERLGLSPERYATLVHPAASIPPSTRVGEGTVLLAGVVATASVTIGAHVAVMPTTVLTHDTVIGDYATLASGVCLSGDVKVESGAYLGAGALVREGLVIGDHALVGMGSVVLTDVPPGEVWAGVPARKLHGRKAAALALEPVARQTAGA